MNPAKFGRIAPRDREVVTSTDRKLKRLHPMLSSPGFDRAIQYPRDAAAKIEKPRRTGCPAFAGHDDFA
jgi:hypothetical protein